MKINNPLDKFQSYSIHYIALAARSTEDVRAFTVDSQHAQSETLSAIDNAKHIGDVIKIANSESFLIIDTRRFSQYTILDFELESLLAGFAVPGSNSPNATAIDLSFTVVDSTGISFANFLQYLMDQKLQVSFDGMTILIRVLFIGHTSTGGSDIVQSMTIPCMFKAIEVDLNEAKGLYRCTMLPMIGLASNARNNPKWTAIGTASSYFTGPSANTLGAVVDSFERRLNEESLKRYTQLNAQVQKNGTKTTVGRYGRPVQYMITLPTGWGKFAFSGPSQGNTTETIFSELIKKEAKATQTALEAQKKSQQNANAPAKDSYVAVNPELSITEVLDVIFSQCLSIAKLGNFTHQQDTDGSIRFYKHLITVTSDNDSFTVHIDVVEFTVPNVDLAAGAGANNVSHNDQEFFNVIPLSDGTKKRIPKQYLEYDYIFSGKNIDVIHLDLKIENLNYLLMQGSKLGQGAIYESANNGQKQTDGESVAKDQHAVYGLRRKDPALIPARSKGDKTNFAEVAGNAKTADGDASPQALKQQYTQNLQAFYASGPVDVKMTIRGNPDLMVFVALQAIPQHISAITVGDGGTISKVNESTKTAYRETFERELLRINTTHSAQQINNEKQVSKESFNSELLNGRNFVSSPVFAKVNVYGPNVDFLTGAASPGDYSQQLFYDNYYFAHQINTKLDGGSFTQDISLRSFSVFNFPNTNAAGANASATKDK